jgi:hypothetical protein
MLDIVAGLVAAGTLRGFRIAVLPAWVPAVVSEGVTAALFWYASRLTGGGVSEGFRLASLGQAAAAAGSVAMGVASQADPAGPDYAKRNKVASAWSNPLSDYSFMQGRKLDQELR